MGWLIWNKPYGDRRTPVEIMRERDPKWWDERVVKAAYGFSAMWMVVRHNINTDGAGWTETYVPDGNGEVRGIAVLLIRNTPKEFGYKDMDETSGPYGAEAPVAIIKAASPLRPLTPEEAAKDFSGLKAAHGYRERSLKAAWLKAAKAKIKDGTLVTLPEPLDFGGRKIAAFRAVAGNFKNRGRKLKLAFVPADGSGGFFNLTATNLAGATFG